MHVLFLILMFLAAPVQEEFAEYTIAPEDGDPVTVRLYSPAFSGAPMIVIVHDWGETLDNWHEVAMNFRELGFSVLLFSLPEHGTGETGHYSHTNREIAAYEGVLKEVYAYARGRTGEVHILGSGLGANLAVLAAEDMELEGRLVAVSPGLNYRGLVLHPETVKASAGRMMLLASQEDTYSAYSIRTMNAVLQEMPEEQRSPHQFYSNAGHGVWMLKRLPESVATIIRWFSGYNQ